MKKTETSAAEKKKKPALKPVIIIVICLVAVFGIAAAILFAINPSQVYSVFKGETVYRNITVGELSISGQTLSEAKKSLEKYEEKLRDEYKLEVECSGRSVVITKNELNIEFNTDEVLNSVSNAKGGEKLELKITVSAKETALQKAINELASMVKVEPIEPKITNFDFETLKFTVSAETNGKRLNVNEAKKAVMNFFTSENKISGKITVETEAVPAKLTKEKLLPSLGEISTHTTECTNVYASEYNMRLAMQKMDKTFVNPGEIYSFHETVGDSTTAEGGWMQSGAYRDGKLQQEYGGGICQAATMLYNCGLKANMEIEERYNHLQPSSYSEPGLDATVDYPYVDCKMKNISEYPIYIVSKMEGKILTMTMYGYISPDYDHIEISGWYTGFMEKPAPEFEVDNSLKEGQYVRERSGYSGFKAEAKRVWCDKDGNTIKEEALPKSYYSAVSPIFKVGPGTDTSKIPLDSVSGIIEPEPEPEPENPENPENPDTPENSENPDAAA